MHLNILTELHRAMARLFPRLTGVPGPAVLTALILKDTHGKGPASEFSVMARGQVGVLPQLWRSLHSCNPQLLVARGQVVAADAIMLSDSTRKAASEVSTTLQGSVSAGCPCGATSVCNDRTWCDL